MSVVYKIKNIDGSIIDRNTETQKKFYSDTFKEEPKVGEKLTINMIGPWDVAPTPVNFIYEGNGVLRASRDVTINSLQGYEKNNFKSLSK